MSRGAVRDWADGPEVAQRYLVGPGATRPARRPGPRAHEPAPPDRGDPRLLPVRLRRRADRDGRRGAPRPAAPAAAAARDAHRGRGRSACSRRPAMRRPTIASRPTPTGSPARPDAARAAVRGRPPRVGGAAARPRARVARTRASCGSSARATGSASCRSATSRSSGSGRYLAWPRGAGWRGPGSRDGPGSPLFVTQRGRAAGRQAGVAGREGRGRGRRARRPGLAAHAAAQLRDAPAGGRRRPAGRPGAPRTCEYLHDPAVHPRDRRADPRGLRAGPPRGPEEDEGTWPTTPNRCSRQASASSAASTSTGSSSSRTRATRSSP